MLQCENNSVSRSYDRNKMKADHYCKYGFCTLKQNLGLFFYVARITNCQIFIYEAPLQNPLVVSDCTDLG